MEHLKEILAGLGSFLVALAVIAACVFVAHDNSVKVREMTQLCISNGHAGWDGDKGCFG